MESMRCYFKEEVDVDKIRDCLKQSAYDAVVDNHAVFGLQLIIHFKHENGSAYTRWYKLEAGLESGFSDEQIARIRGRNIEFRTYFSIMYWFSTIKQLVPIFSLILNCFDGVIECEDGFFDKSNITDLGDVTLPPMDYGDD